MDFETVTWIPLTIASLGAATVFAIRFLYAHKLTMALGFITAILLAVAFVLISISTHSFGLVERTAIINYIRSLLFVAGVLACVFVARCNGITIRRKEK